MCSETRRASRGVSREKDESPTRSIYLGCVHFLPTVRIWRKRRLTNSHQKREGTEMSIGMILLAIWLILNGLPTFVRFVIPSKLMSAIALLAGILILVRR